MATIILEDGTGLASANSYASAAEADTYFGSRPRSSAWTALSADEKSTMLIHATRILDNSCTWNDDKLVDGQALAFPRYSEDTGATGVPACIKTALLELAILLCGSDIAAEPGTSGIQSIKVGPIEISADAQRPAPTIPRFVQNLISPYGTPRGAGGSVRLTRR